MFEENTNTEEELIQEQLLEAAKQNRAYNKKIICFSGLFLSIMAIAIFLVQLLIIFISKNNFTGFYESTWFDIAVTAIGVAGVGLPLFALLMKRLPNSESGKVERLSFGRFVKYFFISIAALYLSSFVSTFINYFIGLMRGEWITNPVEDLVFNSNMVVNILYISIIGPIVEELIFRKILLDKLRRFGDLPAILLTGIAFGLFHMNLSQFLYAATLGILFAYITIRTNTVLYSIILHMMINFIGSGLAPLVLLSENAKAMVLMSVFVYGAMTIGIVLFITNISKINLNKTKVPLVKKSDYILNPGTLLFTFICIGMIALSLL